MPLVALPNDCSGQRVQRHKQGAGAIALVIVGQGATPTRFHRQVRLCPVQRLDSTLFIHPAARHTLCTKACRGPNLRAKPRRRQRVAPSGFSWVVMRMTLERRFAIFTTVVGATRPLLCNVGEPACHETISPTTRLVDINAQFLGNFVVGLPL